MLYSLLFIFLQSTTVLSSMIGTLAEQGALITLFVLICWYLVRQIGKREKEVTDLNDYIRESEKENLQVLNDVNNTLDKVLENQKHSNDMVIKEIENLKEYITLKLDK
jgi:hypothetical protein